jgi:hypothetical protein
VGRGDEAEAAERCDVVECCSSQAWLASNEIVLVVSLRCVIERDGVSVSESQVIRQIRARNRDAETLQVVVLI